MAWGLGEVGPSLKISVILPTFQAAAYWPAWLAAIQQQTLPAELVVVDSSSTDGTADLARAAGARVAVIPQTSFDHGASRNLGASLASGEVLVFMTQDACPAHPEFLAQLIAPLAQPGVGAAFARQIPYAWASPPERLNRLFNYPPHDYRVSAAEVKRLGIRAYFFSNVASAIPRKVFEQQGGFTPGLIMNEDMLFAAGLLQQGYQIAYTAQARVWHAHRYTWVQTFRRYFDIGVFRSRTRAQLPGGRASGEGWRFLLWQSRALLASGEGGWLGAAWLENLARLLGLGLGQQERWLPVWLKPYLSLHPGYWRRSLPGKNVHGG